LLLCGCCRAYYYYNTEVNKTYEETLLDVAAYAAQESIPYRWILLDRWGWCSPVWAVCMLEDG
jgi:hypothetical protein